MEDLYHESRCPGDDPSLAESAAGAFCIIRNMFFVRDRMSEVPVALDEAVRRLRKGDACEANTPDSDGAWDTRFVMLPLRGPMVLALAVMLALSSGSPVLNRVRRAGLPAGSKDAK